MFGGDDEDGDFLSPTGGAKLASLFGQDYEASQGNESFQYTAPKQPRKGSSLATAPAIQKPAPPSETPAVLFASAVQAYKYVNGQYVNQGKLGAAVLGSQLTREYKLLLYLSQQKQVTAAKIHVAFIFTVQPNNYCTFYDDQRQNWSLMFQSDKMASDFCREVCLAKANSSTSLDSVVIQDLSVGEGEAVVNGDSLEVVYTGWLLQNHTIGQMFDSNQNKDKLLRLKLGAGKVIKGWEEGMLGMKKAGRRLIIIPPCLAYGSKGVPKRIPANSTLLFETELRRVKFSKDSGSDRASTSSRETTGFSPASSPAPSVENLIPEHSVQAVTISRPGEPPLRTKSNSLSDQLANPDATKAKLISRMARMGQPMLPFLTGAASQPESSDSELEDTSGSRPEAPSPVQVTATSSASAHVHPHPHTAPNSVLLPLMTSVSPQLPGNSHAFQPYSCTKIPAVPSQMQSGGQVYPAQTLPYMVSGDITSFLMTESRQHHTEISLAMAKVTNRVDQLASKIDDLQRQENQSMSMCRMSMETSMIMHNIQRIIQENECLKKQVFEKNSHIEEQNHKIGDLINQNQRYMEQSHLLLEQRNDSINSCNEQNQARLLQAEKDKVRLSEDLASSTARNSQLQLEASAHQQKTLELQSKLSTVLQDNENHSLQITALETQLKEMKEAAGITQAQHRSEKHRRKEMELKVKTMEEELQDLKTDKESLEQALAERKTKWQAERHRLNEEMKELQKSNQQELDILQAQLRKARIGNNDAASEQLSELQAELEMEWRVKCEQMLALAKEHHSKEVADFTEQKDALRDKLTQLQEKYMALEQQGKAVREKLEKQVTELERKVGEQTSSGDTAAEVKRVMNGVFHSLRAEFDLSETYSGQAALGVIITTIKNVTLQLLSGTDRFASHPSNEEEEAEKESEDVKQMEEKSHQSAHVNGERAVKEGQEKEVEHEQDSNSHQIGVSQEIEAERESVTESQVPSQTDASPDTVFNSELEPQEPQTAGLETEQQQEQEQQSAASTAREEDLIKVVDPGVRFEESSLAEDERERNVVDGNDEEISHGKDAENAGEVNAASQKLFEPPVDPPPPPNTIQKSSTEDMSLTEEMSKENGKDPFFQITSPAKSRAASTEDEEEDEMNLKGCPPPTPLFGDEDDDDLDWLN